MAWMDGLSGMPLAIAMSAAFRVRVMAGPGTGKSYAMTRRLMRLLEEDVPARRILVVTFTRTAAAALLEEISGLNVAGCQDVWAGTLHGFCFGLLGKRDVLAQTGRVPRPLVTFPEVGVLQFEAAPMLEDLGRVVAAGHKRDRTKRIRAFEADWARLQSDTPGPPQSPVDIAFRNELRSWLKFHEAMLIGELVPEALRYLRTNPACPERRAFDHVLVDEYQDLNKAEQVLIGHLVDNAGCCVFGDEDQSIYSFRCAHPEGIVQFDQMYPPTTDYQLDECRRCPTRVVEVADNLIRHNHPAGVPSRLISLPGKPLGDIHLVQWDGLEEEAKGLVTFVRFLRDKRGYEPGDILILCPRRLIGYRIRDALLGVEIPTHSFYDEEPLEAPEAKRAFTLLNLLAKPDDRVSLRYWLGDGSPTWNARGYAVLRQHCVETGLSPWQGLQALQDGTVSLSHTAPLVEKFKELRGSLAELNTLNTQAVIDSLLPDGQPWAANLRTFAMMGGVDDIDSAALLDRLQSQITQPEIPEAGQFVRIMSLHKSKGLTSKAVIVVGCMQGLIPNLRTEGTPQELEAYEQEQRRLFYVALTRCTDVLLLSSVFQLERRLAYQLGGIEVRQGKGIFVFPIASRFLDELGPTAPASQRGGSFLKQL